jgi:hypothetical protein
MAFKFSGERAPELENRNNGDTMRYQVQLELCWIVRLCALFLDARFWL